LLTQLQALGEIDLAGICCDPTVVMTEPLPYEGKLESFGQLILTKCKEAFIADLFVFEPFSDPVQRHTILGTQSTLTETFDQWWTAEQVDTLEIQTTW
jgi:hypothetical protein